MPDLSPILRSFISSQGAALVATIAGLLLSLVVLPKHERRELKLPLLLLIAHGLVVVIPYLWRPHEPSSHNTSVIGVVLLFSALARVSFLLVVDWLIGKRLGKPLPKIFRDIIQGLFFLAVVLAVLHAIGVELGSLLATSAILTAVLGLSLQETLGNLFAGLAVHTERPFEVGDWVQFGDSAHPITGRVVEINWRATKLRTNDLTEVIVPNGLIAKSTIQNFGRPEPLTRRMVTFQAPYEISPDRVRLAVEGCLAHVAGIAEAPAPMVWTSEFCDSGVTYSLVFFITDYGPRLLIDSEVRSRIWYALRRSNLSMPYPVRDLRLYQHTDSPLSSQLPWETAQSVELLSRVEFFAGLPDTLRRRLSELACPLCYGPDEPIVLEGAAGNDLFVVAKGQVSVITHTADGEVLKLATLKEGQLFGELSLLTGTRGATVKATTESLVLRIGHDAFRTTIEQIPDLADTLLTRLAERQERLARADESPDQPANVEFRQALFTRIRRLFST